MGGFIHDDEDELTALIDDLFNEDLGLAEYSGRMLLRSHQSSGLPDRIPELTKALKFNLEREKEGMAEAVLEWIIRLLVQSLQLSPNLDSLGVLIQALKSSVAPYAALGISYIPNKSAVEPLIDSIQNSEWEEVWSEEDLKVYRNLRKLQDNPDAALELTTHVNLYMPLTSTAIKTLGIIGDSRAIDILTKFTHHEYVEISEEAKKSIERIIESSK